MGWFKFDDNIGNNKKFLSMGRKRIYKVSEKDLAELVYERCIGWCSRNLSDGLIPDAEARELDPTGGMGVDALLRRTALVRCGSEVDQMSILLQQEDRQGMLIIPDYLDWQRSRAQVEHERERDRQKKQRYRSAGKPQGDPPVSPGDTRGDRNGRPLGTPAGTNGNSRSRVPGGVPVPTDTDTDNYSSTEDDSRNVRARVAQTRTSARSPSSELVETSEWAYDGNPRDFVVNWENPRCANHYKIPLGMRGPACGTCAQLAKRARAKDASTSANNGFGTTSERVAGWEALRQQDAKRRASDEEIGGRFFPRVIEGGGR